MSTLGNNLLAQYYAQNQGLPFGYEAVDWIASPLLTDDSTTYIDSGVMSANDSLAFDVEFKFSAYEKWASIFKAYLDESHNTTRLIRGEDDQLLAFVNVRANLEGVVITGVQDNEWLRVKMTQGVSEFNGSTYTANITKGVAYNAPIRILVASGTIYKYIRFLRISDTSGMIRTFIPCIRKSDNKPGLYDLCKSICPLTGTPFYINAGTGEFVTP